MTKALHIVLAKHCCRREWRLGYVRVCLCRLNDLFMQQLCIKRQRLCLKIKCAHSLMLGYKLVVSCL